VKIVATAVSLEVGGSGGIVTPLFFIGATSGAALARLFYLPIGAVAAATSPLRSGEVLHGSGSFSVVDATYFWGLLSAFVKGLSVRLGQTAYRCKPRLSIHSRGGPGPLQREVRRRRCR